MLNRQYGVAAASAVVQVAHPEDSQPNEGIHGRTAIAPPRLANTARAPRFDHVVSNSNQRFQQTARRGSWKGRGGSTRPEASSSSKASSREPPRGSRGDNHASSSSNSWSRRQLEDLPRGQSTRPTYRPSLSTSSPRSGPASKGKLWGNNADIHFGFANSSSLSSGTIVEPTLPQMPKASTLSAKTQIYGGPPLAPQPAESTNWLMHYRSPSPKLPPEPLRRRTPQDAPPLPLSHSLPPKPSAPLPGRKRKAEDDPSSLPQPPQKPKTEASATRISTPPPVIHVKDESLSPESVPPQRKLVSQACSFWAIPDNCKKSYPNFKDNRIMFARERHRELVKLGLKKVRAFFRDDGLAIEWTSDVPVWNDTLLADFPHSTPRNPSTRQTTSSSNRGSSGKRKRDIVDVIDVEALSTPTKKARPSGSANVEGTTPSTSQQSAQSQNSSYKKRKRKEKPVLKHWAAGLTLDEIRNLGRCVKATHSPPSTPPPSSPKPIISAVTMRTTIPTARITPTSMSQESLNLDSTQSTSSSQSRGASAPWSTKRTPLPTRMDPAERAKVLAAYHERKSSTPLRASSSSSLHTLGHSADPQRRSESISHSEDTVFVEPTRRELSSSAFEDDTIYARRSMSSGLLEEAGKSVHHEQHVPVETSAIQPLTEIGVSIWEADTDREVDCVVESLLRPSPEDLAHAEYPDGGWDDNAARSSWDREMQGIQGAVQVSEEYERISQQSEAEQGPLEESPEYDLAEEFLRRYIDVFDENRTNLEFAYAKDALFSCRVHHTQQPSLSMAGLFAPEPKTVVRSSHTQSSASTVEQGRTKIINRLRALGTYYFQPRLYAPRKTIYYDVAALSGTLISEPATLLSSDSDGHDDTLSEDTRSTVPGVGGILATLHSEIVDPNAEDPTKDHILTLDQSFVLRRRVELDDAGSDTEDGPGLGLGSISIRSGSERAWPLVIVSHQMTVRDGPLLPADKVEKLLPWVRRLDV